MATTPTSMLEWRSFHRRRCKQSGFTRSCETMTALANNTALGTGYVDHTTYDSITEMSALFEIPFACEQKCNELHLASLLTPGLQSDCHAIQLDWNSKRCNYCDIDVAGYITVPVQTLLSDNDYYFDPLASYDRQIPAYAGTVTWYRNVYAPPKAPPPSPPVHPGRMPPAPPASPSPLPLRRPTPAKAVHINLHTVSQANQIIETHFRWRTTCISSLGMEGPITPANLMALQSTRTPTAGHRSVLWVLQLQ